MSELTQGERIKFLREKRGVSQLDLEISIGASSGMVSRIENSKTNPQKETLLKISEVLVLSPIEIQYLFGIGNTQPTEKDINNARGVFSSILDSNKYVYLLNNRSEIIHFSKGFERMIRKANLIPENLVNKSVAEILFNPDLGVRQIIPKDRFEETAKTVVAVISNERAHLLEEPWWKEFIEKMHTYPDFTELWEYTLDNDIDLYSEESRRISFGLIGLNLSFIYTIHFLYTDPRFSLVEYSPENEQLKSLLDLLT
jgi:transcriptional regulator with XRE-family HTH domain